MFNKDKICGIILIGTAVIGTVVCGVALAKIWYYKGRIDANNEHIENLKQMRNEILKVVENKETEAE